MHPLPCFSLAEAHPTESSSTRPLNTCWRNQIHTSNVMCHPGPEVAGGAWPPAGRHQLEPPHGPAQESISMVAADTEKMAEGPG